jgi:hypothetical protein
LGRAIALGSLCAASGLAAAQTACNGAALRGRVVDPSAAIIPGAVVTLDGRAKQTSGSDGGFTFPCVAPGAHRLHTEAQSFAPLDSNITATNTPRELKLTLKPADVETTVRVDASGDSLVDVSPTSSGPAETLAGDQLQALADDPDDLLRELQQMASAAGGSPGGASIGIDGFSGNGDGGTSLPPKSSIAFIKVNPDLFSAEYRNVPFGGGEIQIYTKPGQSAFHGALFATNSSSWMNARDPFSTSTVPIGKQRYGAELSGPVLKHGSDFTLTLEHRAINNVASVDAIVPDASGNPSAFTQTVPAPQALWIGLARSDWQLGAKNLFTVSFNANHNTFVNSGVGGIVLPEGGYNEDRYEYILHLTDITTISPRLMHELRVGVMWDGRTDAPNSTAPQVQVAGDFTGGGNTLQTKRLNEKYNTWDEDAVWTISKHLLKFGIQTEFLDQHKRLPTNFNGTYIFGGTSTQTPLQQYNAGTPTDYSDTEGNPEMDFVQVRIAAFVQDDWKLRPNLHLAAGLRYYGQNDLTFVHNYTPRFGLTWTPDKKATWSIHAHAGMFTGRFQSQIYATFITEDGVQRVTSTVYSPSAYCPTLTPAQFNPTCNPFNNATTIQTIYTAQPGLPNTFFSIEDLGVSHSLPHGWTLTASYDQSQIWHYTRAENINAPLNNSPTGPRPGPANLNILQVQGTGRGYGNVTFASIEQHSLKRLQIFFGAVRNQIVDDTDDTYFLTPQTTGVNTGEYARRDTNGLWNVFGNITVTLPYKLKLGTVFNATGGMPFNITTGNDNNGDGDFNDRPRYAPAGTPLCTNPATASPCAYATPYGLLTNTGFGPTIARNKGVMPWTAYLDLNLQRTFTLTHDPKAPHPQTLALNLRASNALNHLNVTQEGNVLGSSLFNRPDQADNGRRIEAGARYTF